jgi:hypothetical protein
LKITGSHGNRLSLCHHLRGNFYDMSNFRRISTRQFAWPLRRRNINRGVDVFLQHLDKWQRLTPDNEATGKHLNGGAFPGAVAE